MTLLSITSDSLPGRDIEEKIALAKELNLNIDYVLKNKEDFPQFFALINDYEVPCRTVLVHQCHNLNILSNPEDREKFNLHVRGALDIVRTLGASEVLTAVYEKQAVPDQRIMAQAIYQSLLPLFSPKFKLLIESLNEERTAFLPNITEMHDFVSRLPRLGLVIDAAHAVQSELDFDGSLALYAPFISQVHLKDTNSLPPGQGNLNFEEIFKTLSQSRFQGSFTIECQPPTNLRQTLEYLKPKLEKYFSQP